MGTGGCGYGRTCPGQFLLKDMLHTTSYISSAGY